LVLSAAKSRQERTIDITRQVDHERDQRDDGVHLDGDLDVAGRNPPDRRPMRQPQQRKDDAERQRENT
jgi:hypothetical protein